MATIQTIGIGAAANDGTGDTLRDAFEKVNANAAALNAAIIALQAEILPATIAAGTEGQVITTVSGLAIWKDPASSEFTPLSASTITAASHSPASGFWYVYTNVGAITVTLDATMVDNGEALVVKGSGAGAITISPDEGFTINGAGSSVTLVSAALVKRIGTNFVVSGGTSGPKSFDTSDLQDIGDLTMAGDLAVAGDAAFSGEVSGNGINVIARGAGTSQPTAADSGAWILSDGAITIPNSAIGSGWFHCTLEFGGDHNITFNSLTLDISAFGDGYAADDVVSVVVKSATTIRVVGKNGVADQTDFA